MFLADKPWPSRKNPLYVTGKLRRLEDVIWMRIHRPCALRGHPRSLSCLCKKVTKERRRGLQVVLIDRYRVMPRSPA